MHPIEKQLYTDHHHLQSLMCCLHKQIDRYAIRDSGRVELPLILDALDYIRVYPEKWHHPMEDKIFAILLSKNLPEAELIIQIEAEHSSLENLTSELNRLFCAVANDCIVPVDELVDKTRNFLWHQGAHIERENNLIYPLFDQHLTPADWRAVEQEMDLQEDPLFGQSIKADYENLYQHIIATEQAGFAA